MASSGWPRDRHTGPGGGLSTALGGGMYTGPGGGASTGPGGGMFAGHCEKPYRSNQPPRDMRQYLVYFGIAEG